MCKEFISNIRIKDGVVECKILTLEFSDEGVLVNYSESDWKPLFNAFTEHP